jgi:hypothetical protein
MKLCAIYNVWDGEELIKGSMECLKYHVDLFIIVWQDISNYGEPYNPISKLDISGFKSVILHKYFPNVGSGIKNERVKRNIGLEIAKENNCTHFLHIDVDEYYENFGEAKDLYIRSGWPGSVCKLYTYFKKPTLRFEQPDNYYVPFIHELKANTEAGGKNKYPFYVDPTRRINEDQVIELPVFMHHFSYIRKNMTRKLNNSSAKHNINQIRHVINQDLEHAADGYFCNSYDQKLVQVENKFNIRI